MAKQFQYTVQAEGHVNRAALLAGNDIHANWAIFHKNPEDKGLWTVDPSTGYLRITTNQNGLSGRYDPKALTAKDYNFYTEVIPSAVDDDSFGIHFRYQDNFHFYFVAWDGGGEYGWGENSLRLYKIQGDDYILLAENNMMGHWSGGTKYKFEIRAENNLFVIMVDGQERLRVVDDNKPYLQGAYGPCATSQPTTWTYISHKRDLPFMLSQVFNDEVTIENNSAETGKALASSTPVGQLMQPYLDSFITENSYDPATAGWTKFSISEEEASVNAFFNPSAPAASTTSALDVPYAYMLYAEAPPSPPENMKGEGLLYSIVWSWTDASISEDGFEILDENGEVLAVVGNDTTEWEESGLEPNTLVTRKVRAYNQWGVSIPIQATARTDKAAVVMTPDAPHNLRGMTNGTTQITWYWDRVEGAEYYRVWDRSGLLITTTTSLRFPEDNLTPDTAYERYVTAHNLAGISSPSNIALAFTEPLPVVIDAPNAPIELVGEPLGENTILWQWQAPTIDIDPLTESGLDKTQEEIDTEREKILSTISYRMYDMNGEVLSEVSPNNFEFMELNLTPDTSYTHYVKAFIKTVEGPRSNYAYARTEAPYIEEEEVDPAPEWPIPLACEPHEKEPQEKIRAFHSGIGDNLDLNTRINKKGIPREPFTYDIQLKGWENAPIEVYPERDFKFRFKAEGIEKIIVWTGEYIANLSVYPKKSYQYKVDAKVLTSSGFSYKAMLKADVTKYSQSPIPFNYRPYANVNYTQDTLVTTESMFSGPNATVWGPNTWNYDPATDIAKGLQNTGWSGFYNKDYLTLEDYSFECRMGVMGAGGDNDMIGMSFRLQENSDGTKKFYYIASDKNNDSGTGIPTWRLIKVTSTGSGYVTTPLQVGQNPDGSNPGGWIENRWYHLLIEASGPRIRIWLDGSLIIDVTDDDPMFNKGSFGPTNYSQVGCSFKDFKMTKVSPERVYGSWASNTVTDVNNSSANAKELTSQTASALLSSNIQTAYNTYKAQPGRSSALLSIIDYGVEDDNANAVTTTAIDGTSKVKVYTAATTMKSQKFPVTLESDTFTDTIDESNASQATNKILTQTLNGVTKAHTLQELFAKQIQDYKTDNGIADADFTAKSYEVASLTNDITVYTGNTSGTDTVHAYTATGTIYTASKTYNGTLYAHEGWKKNSEPASALILKNKKGETYTGNVSSIDFTLTNLSGANAEVVWDTSGVAGTIKGSDYHKVRTTDVMKKEINGTVDGKNPKYFFVGDLLTIPNTPEYAEAHLSLDKTGGNNNTFVYFRSNREQVSFKDEVFSYQKDDVVVVSANEREIEKSWISYSEWYDGQVNGQKPFKKNGDGKLDLHVPIEVVVPDTVQTQIWTLELEDKVGDINYIIENGVDKKTSKPNDVVVFWSDTTGPDTARLTYYGPKVSGETVYEVKADEDLLIKDKFLSPYRDPLLSEKNIQDWKVIVTSRNPNVEIHLSDKQTEWNKESLFLDVLLEAHLINPTQTAWNPLIHEGYYYFNQREYFLYADTKIKGKYTQAQGFQPVEFPYTVKAHCERITQAGIQYWTDSNRSDFRGVATGIDLDTLIGDMTLAKVNDAYVSAGNYVSDIKGFNGDSAEEWKEFSWSADTPFGAEVKVETSTFDKGVWTDWLNVNNGEIIGSPVSDKLRYRVSLKIGEEKSPRTLSQVDTLTAQFNQGAHSNTVALQDSLRMLDTSLDKGTWLSRTFDLGDNIDSMGRITYTPYFNNVTGEKLELFTVSSANIDGPWDGTGEPLVPLSNITNNLDGTMTGMISSNKNRYLRYQVRFTRGRQDAVFTVSLTNSSDFSKGTLTNIALSATQFQMADAQKDAIFISAPLDMGNVVTFREVTLDATNTNNGVISLSTLSASSLSDFSTLEADETNWKPVSLDGSIVSSPARYMKVKALVQAGSNDKGITTMTQDTQEQFAASASVSNTKAENGMVVLVNPRNSGYYESTPMDFTTLNAWTEVTHVTTLNSGTIKVLTATSDASIGPWSAWEELGVGNAIVSPKKNFIKYRLELGAGTSSVQVAYKDDTKATFQDTGTGTNITYDVTHTRVKNTDAHQQMSYTSGIKLFDDIEDYLTLSYAGLLATSAELSIYTRTSNEQSNWSIWEPLAEDGSIVSPVQKYLRYRLDVTPGYGTPKQKRVFHDSQSAFNTGSFLDNTKVAIASGTTYGVLLNQVIDASQVLKAGNFYSPLWDFDGRVTAWESLSVAKTLPAESGDVKLYTVSSNDASVIAATNVTEAAALPWVEATLDGVTGTYVIHSAPARYIRYRLYLQAGYGVVKQATENDDTTLEWNTNSGIVNMDILNNDMQVVDATQAGTFTSAARDFTALYPKWEGLKSFDLSITGATEGGLVELSVQSADVLANVSTAPVVSLGTVQNGHLTDVITGIARYMQYTIQITPGLSAPTLASFIEASGTFSPIGADDSNVEFDSNNRLRVSTLFTADITPPGEIRNVVVTNITDVSATITWDNPLDTDFVGVAIYDDLGNVINPSVLSPLDVGGLTADKDYSFVLKTYDDMNNYSAGQTVTFHTSMPMSGMSMPNMTIQSATANTGTFISNPKAIANFVSWGKATLTHTNSYTNAVLFTDVQGADDTWEGWKQVAPDGTIASRATDVKAVRYQVVMTAEKKSGTWGTPRISQVKVEYNVKLPMSPVVNFVSFTSDVRYEQSPAITYVDIATTATGYESFAASEVGDIEINYKKKQYASPSTDSVSVSGSTSQKVSPVIDNIYVNADVIYWKTPILQSAQVDNDLYDVVYHPPVMHDLTYGAKLPDQVIQEEYGVSLMGSVLSDQASHAVSDVTMKTVIDNYMAEYGINQSNLVRRRYSIVSGIAGIFVETKENNASVYYENGESEVYARTTEAATETIFSQAKVIVDENNEALVTPIPQQGSPIVVRDASGTELTHVTFLDENGALTLMNQEKLIATGERHFSLAYDDIDLSTLEVWVDENRTNVYTKVEEFMTCNHVVYTRYTYQKGTPIIVKYILKNSYYVDYNYNISEGYAMIKLHNPVLTGSRDITVRYETNTNTAYYNSMEIDLNPMQNLLNEGFIYITDEVEPSETLDVYFNPSTLNANGYDRTTILVIAKDRFGNPVVGDIMNFQVTDGELTINQLVTDINGMAIATYTAGLTAGDVELTVLDRTSRIEARKTIHLRSPKAQPRITVDVNKPVVSPDNKDRAKITARVVNANQEPAINVSVLFESTEAIVLDSTDTTNYIGEAYSYVKADRVPSDGIITIRVSVPSLGIVEYVNIRANEVAPIV